MHEPRLQLIIGISTVVSLVGFNFRVLVPLLASKTLAVGAGTFGVLYACSAWVRSREGWQPQALDDRPGRNFF